MSDFDLQGLAQVSVSTDRPAHKRIVNDAVNEIAHLRSELTAARDEAERLRGRVVDLELREDAMCDLAYANGARQGFSLGQLSDNEGLEQIVAPRYLGGVADLKRLRQQADELGKGE